MSRKILRPNEGEGDPNQSSLARRVAELEWFHSIDLGDGIVTPGTDDSSAKLRNIEMPTDLSGQTVLDIGAYDGFFSFEASRRNAKSVLAIDTLAWERGPTSGWPCFELARRALGSQVEARKMDVMSLDRAQIGGFDLVLCLGVFYHLRNPLGALEKIASVTDDQLILETHTDLNQISRPAMAFYEHDDLAYDESNWWGPNEPAVRSLLTDVGFRDIRIVHRRSALKRIMRAIWYGRSSLSRAISATHESRIVVHATKK